MRRTLVLCTLLAGCNGAAGDPAYLLLDADALRAGMKVELAGGWSGAPLLPLELRAGEPVTLAGAGFRTPLQLEAGKLAWVRGAGAEVVTAEIDPDRLIVEAPADAVRTLAQLLGAETLGRADGRAELKVADLFGRTSFLTAPDAIVAVEPVAPRIAGRTPLVGASTPTSVISAGELDPRASMVGLYFCNESFVVLDGEGGFTHGDQRGRWTMEGAELLLHADGGDSRALTIQDGSLRDVDGTFYRPLTEVCK